MIQYHTDMANRPPMTPDIQQQRMREMSRFAPIGGEDTYASSLNLPAYQREAEMANMGYQMDHRKRQNASVLEGLGMLTEQQGNDNRIVGSLLGNLFRDFA